MIMAFQFGAKTVYEVAPFGDDSCPPQGADIITSDTVNDNCTVSVGVINNNQQAGPGEKRMYAVSVDDQGNITEAFYTWMKKDGTFEIGGAIDFAVRFNALNAGLQAQVTKMEGQLTLIAAGIATAGGSYTPGDISLDISAAKIDKIKTL